MASLLAQTVKHLPAIWEPQVRSLGWEDPLEKQMAPHSSTLAWKIPWTEEPGGLQSTASQSGTLASLSWLNCDVSSVSGVQQRESITHGHTPILTVCPCSPFQSIEKGSVHYSKFLLLLLLPGRPLVPTRAHSCLTAARPASLPLPRGLPKSTFICVIARRAYKSQSPHYPSLPYPMVTLSLFSTS